MVSPRLEVLECFALVAASGSISEAARQLDVSQPTVSRRIRQLEERLAVRLFTRIPGGIQLTESGHRLLTQLKPMLGRIEALFDDMADSSERCAGQITLAALSAHGESVLIPRILEFRANYPEVDFRIEFTSESEIFATVREGRADCGIVTGIPEGSWMRCYRLADERAVLVTAFDAPGQAESLSDLAHSTFVAYRVGDPLLDRFLRQITRIGGRRRLKTPFVVNSHRAMIDALRSGVARYAVLPYASVADAIKTHVLRVASTHELRGAIFLGHRAEFELTQRHRLFIAHLQRDAVGPAPQMAQLPASGQARRKT